jgi:hypothetical protein
MIALTPWAGPDAREALVALGFQGHCPKPFSAYAIACEVLTTCTRQAMAAAAWR